MMAFALSSESSPRDRPRTFSRSPCGSATKLHLANRPQTATSGCFSTPCWATRLFSRIATGLKRRGRNHSLHRLLAHPGDGCRVYSGKVQHFIAEQHTSDVGNSLRAPLSHLCLRAPSMASKIRTDVREHPSSLVSRKRSL